jgi:NTE family protein
MNVALVLGGGVALGAYHGGAYAALHERPELHPARIAGSSVGAVMGALILGKAPQERMPRLRVFWGDAALDTPWSGADTLGDEWRRASNRLAILQVRALGRAGFFHSRLPSALLGSDIAL